MKNVIKKNGSADLLAHLIKYLTLNIPIVCPIKSHFVYISIFLIPVHLASFQSRFSQVSYKAN